MKKYQKTNGYYVYAHITPEKAVYIGTSKRQPYKRWSPSLYKQTALYEYIKKYGWDNIKHEVIQDGLTREQALQLEDLLIQEHRNEGHCINKQRSGLITVTDFNAYKRQYISDNDEYRDKQMACMKRWRTTIDGKIYTRVTNYNRLHPDKVTETPMEAKQKYLATGYIPNYIKNNDLKNN